MAVLRLDLELNELLQTLAAAKDDEWTYEDQELLHSLYSRVFGTKHNVPIIPETLDDAMKLEAIRPNLSRVTLATVEQTFGVA